MNDNFESKTKVLSENERNWARHRAKVERKRKRHNHKIYSRDLEHLGFRPLQNAQRNSWKLK